MKITDQVWQFAEPIVQEKGCSLWDVEYVREGGEWFLRLYIDKDGGVDINDCENVSRKLDKILDQVDPIDQSYCLEVSSPGIERELVKKAVLDQLSEIASGNISPQELEMARRSIANSYRQIYDTPFDIQSFYSGRSFFSITDTIEICEQKLLKVSAEEISELASQVTLDAAFFVEGTGGNNDFEEDCEND